VVLDGRGGRQGVSIDLDATRLAVAGRDGELAHLAALSLRGGIADATGAPSVHVTARGQGVSVAGQPEVAAALSLQGPLSGAALSLYIDGPPAFIDHLSLASRIAVAGPVTTLRLTAVAGEVAGQPIALQAPFELRLQGSDLLSDELALGVGHGRLAVRIERRAPSISGYAMAQRVALPLPAAGPQARRIPERLTLDGEVRFGTAAGLIDGTLRLEAAAAAAAGASTGAVLRADGELRAGRLTGEAAVSGLDGIRAEASGALPLAIPAASLSLVPDDSSTVAGRLTFAADLAQVAGLLALSDQRLTGRAGGDFSISGRRGQPEIAGAVQITDAAVEDFLTGLRITGLSGGIAAASPRQLTISIAGTADPGTIAVDGTVQLDEPDGIAADLSLRAVNATVLRRDDVTARLDADLAYRGGLTRGAISGTIRTDEVNIRLVDRLPPSIVILPVREINRPGGDPAGDGGGAGGSALQTALDLAVAMPARVFVRGRGLTSEWSGDLRISGAPDDPRIRGTVSMVRGNVIFGGKRFDLASGRLTFTGGTPVDPLIDLSARYQTATLTAIIAVSGPASDPKIEMTSQPPLPQSEVLSQVLFGKSAAKLGPVQALQLASALDTLARGESVSENVLDFTRTFLGLDVLTVGPAQGADGGQGAEVGVGRYIGDDIYIGASRGIGEENSTGTVQVEILPGIEVQSEVSQTTAGPAAGFGLRWRYDY
jgi:translocation and assembly module TamB